MGCCPASAAPRGCRPARCRPAPAAWPRSRPCWRIEIARSMLWPSRISTGASRRSTCTSAVPLSVAQGVETQLDILHPGNFGLLEGLVQVFAPIRKQHDALGAFLGEQRQGQLQRPGDIGAGGHRHRSQPGQALSPGSPGVPPGHLCQTPPPPPYPRRASPGPPGGCTLRRRPGPAGEMLSDLSSTKTTLKVGEGRWICRPARARTIRVSSSARSPNPSHRRPWLQERFPAIPRPNRSGEPGNSHKNDG